MTLTFGEIIYVLIAEEQEEERTAVLPTRTATGTSQALLPLTLQVGWHEDALVKRLLGLYLFLALRKMDLSSKLAAVCC